LGRNGRLPLLAAAAMLCFAVQVVGAAEDRFPDGLNLYCKRKNCYEVLQIEVDATTPEIKKAYRKMSLMYHPDKSDAPDAQETFMMIASAYEVLGSVEVRKAYDDFLANPQRHVWQHYSRYYSAVYSPKSDLRLVVLGMLVAASALQLASWTHARNRILDQIKGQQKTQTAIKSRIKDLGGTNLNLRKPDQYKRFKEIEAEAEYEILSAILVNDIPLTAPGKGYLDTVLGFLLLLPLDLAKLIFLQLRWFVLFSIMRKEYGPDEMEQVTRSKIGFSASKWVSIPEEEREELVGKMLWLPENFEIYDQGRKDEAEKAKQKMMESNKYKMYKRQMKKQ